MANILIVDDFGTIQNTPIDILAENGHQIDQAASGEEAIALLRQSIFDIALVDLRIGHVDGLNLLKSVKDISPDTEVIMITDYATVYTAVEAMKLGAYDFITKPVNMEELLLIIDRVLQKRELADSVRALQTQVKERYRFSSIIGNTPAMLHVFDLMERVFEFDSAVLITGESGTGKELVARSIHENSPRRDKPFVPVNCAALPEEIQESELFGHAKGAFTDAIHDKKGLFEAADGGTAFLDEIGDASLSTQAKLLRFLEDGEIRKIGENKPVYLDVRLIAATNKDLSAAVEEDKFREDLYYRINVIRIHLPPLRERKDDIPILAQHFLQQYASNGKNTKHISRDAFSLLMQYDWPGNVRELQNAMQHAVALANYDTISPSSLPSHIRKGNNGISTQNNNRHIPLRDLKKAYIIKILEEYSGNCKKAAEALGIGKATIYRKLKEYDSDLPRQSSIEFLTSNH